MSTAPKPPGPDEPGVRNYMIVCAGALAVVALALWQRGVGTWSLFPPLVGLVVLLVRWRLGPLMFLVSLAGLLYVSWLAQSAGWPPRPPRWSPLADLVLCVGALAFLAGHYRLQGLWKFLFPRDPRRPAESLRPPPAAPPRGPLPLPPQRRSARLASASELALLLLSLPVWAGLALLAFRWLVPPAGDSELFEVEGSWPGQDWVDTVFSPLAVFLNSLWHLRLVLWTVGVGLLVAFALLGHVAWRRLSPEEAALALQEVAWRETRREQRRINSWVAWAR